MKKLLIILTFFFSTIFYIDNVSAESYESFLEDAQENGVTFSCNEETGQFQVNGYNAGNCTNYQPFVDNIDNLHYYIINDTNMVVSTKPIVYATGNYGSSYHSYGLMNVPSSFAGNFTYFYNNGSPWFSVTSYSTNNGSTPSRQYGTSGSLLSSIYTNTDIYQYDSSNSNGTWQNLNNLLYEANALPTEPTVSITKESETTVTIENETFISSVTLNIEFSIIDNDKYYYLYKYGSDSEWAQIYLTQSNSISKTFNTNDTLYVQILDQVTQQTISAATYTLDSINYNFEPYIDFKETIPTACSFYKNGRSYTICKDVNVSAKNLQDGNYIASYSFNKTDWTNFVDTTISVNENTTIYFQIVNYLTNEVSYRSTYTVGNIDTDISELGVFNTYRSTYDKDTSFITAYINIYNLSEPVQDNYKIYYSYNSTSFIDITLLLTDMTNYYQYEINNINENKTIYFKITDLNDNILYTSTYTINYQIQANENSNFFTSFRTNFHGLSDIISTPLYAIKKINTGVCTPLEIPIPYTNKKISLPCMTTVYENNMPEILNIWQIVTNGIISYYIILDLFRIVKSFKEPEEDKIEVIDL